MTISLSPDSFHDFFKAIYQFEPFPWQQELVRRLIQDNRWPSLLDLPTAAGKTAIIDVAVFHLAYEADKGPHRKAPRRILFVIDRRIVVDAAHDRAVRLAKALRNSNAPVVREVSRRLALLSGNTECPLDVVRLRGGAPLETDWARSPVQPLVAVSTVDQVGSRLLFRGYGVSRRMWPVHAGLVGADALWLLDEVHLSKPLVQTLDAIESGHSEEGGGLLAQRPRLAPFSVVKLSATPGTALPKNIFPGQGFDIRENAPKTFLDRLAANKMTKLIAIEGDPIKIFAHHALCMAGLKKDCAEDASIGAPKIRCQWGDMPPARRVAVVVNRVAVARSIFESIRKVAGERAEVVLLTGRVRPLDRENILGKIAPLLANPNRPLPDKPFILVATQTIEAGADLDVDALVTEIAPLDSLRQRFGRLDRLGLLGRTRAVILFPPGKPPGKKDATARNNPWTPLTRIYGSAGYETKQWLSKLKGEIDFGVDAFQQKLDELDQNILQKLLAPQVDAPVLLPPYAELWSTTSPPPVATPEPSLFLHGPLTSADVNIVWRADIDPERIALARLSMALCPPSSLEHLSVPCWAAKRWLEQGKAESDFADVPQKQIEHIRNDKSTLPVLRWDGEDWSVLPGNKIKPGDTIVVPSSYGGCDAWGWSPNSKEEVSDHGTESNYFQRGKGCLRINHAVLHNTLMANGVDGKAKALEIWSRVSRLFLQSVEDLDAEALRTILTTGEDLPDNWRKLLLGMEGLKAEVFILDPEKPENGLILATRKPLSPNILGSHADEQDYAVESITGRDTSWAIGAEVTLADHLDHVARFAEDFATKSGLDEHTVTLVRLATKLHDLGKAEPRFQLDLRGAGTLAASDPILAALLLLDGEMLAKSARTSMVDGHNTSRQRAAPKGFRHEALSVALAVKHREVVELSEEDQDLVLWLIGTHHGLGRPFFPPCNDPEPKITVHVRSDGDELTALAMEAPLRLDQGWFELAARIIDRFGPWELARLEAIVRLADHAASAWEQQNK